MQVSATDAKNRLGQMLAEAKRGPVFIDKAGRPDSVLLSIEDYRRLVDVQGGGASLDERRRQFDERYKDWIAEQNHRVAALGAWNEALRVW